MRRSDTRFNLKILFKRHFNAAQHSTVCRGLQMETLKEASPEECVAALDSENQWKNRYQNILAKGMLAECGF